MEFKIKRDLNLQGGILISNPIPKEYEIPNEEINVYIEEALNAAKKEGIKGKDTTPFLLAHIKEHTKGRSLESNIQLVYNNARVGALVSKAYSNLKSK